ncbi:MAG: bifunctional phosphoribosylaminoimidazolecarboxamide formyltransferase/inosine monophosphate cyclohydrolase [Phycisphaerae bacterium]|nr:bifunctional phosphoribosylaminoimidazolecarboxamide formyltransferase/inosine monophosphate cyclohydrolase [Phycisphaerae bacterium]
MPDLVSVKRALLSVSDKSDLVPFAKALIKQGVEILSTGGTARALREADVPVTDVSEVTQFPEIMDGRVKTLHPAIHGGLLARRSEPSHVAAMETHAIQPIDLACINLYPFELTIQKDGIEDMEAIEQIDIGGPSMVRSAAKNHESVCVVTSPAQYDKVISELNTHDGCTTMDLRRSLAAAAFARTARYDAAITAWMSSSSGDSMPEAIEIAATREQLLRYGENPHQNAALYIDPSSQEAGIASAIQHSGKPLSFNNINDAAAALETCRDLHLATSQFAAVVVKHTNPCGAAVSDSPAMAFEAAHEGDPLAAYGGILAMTSDIDATIASAITGTARFLEVIIASGYDPEAIEQLSSRWPNVRLLEVADITSLPRNAWNIRSIGGGFLVQDRDRQLATPTRWQVAVGKDPDEATSTNAVIAWTVAKHLTSNAIAVAGSGRLLGVGSGQVDRVTACRLAVEKAGEALGACTDAVAASDAFFPFADGPEILLKAGIRCLVQPGGSKRDEETLQACKDHDATCLLTGIRSFRH